MKRVLHLIKGLGPGGAEHLLLSAAPYLNRSRYDYHIAYLLPWKDDLVASLAAEGITSHCLHGQRGLRWLYRLRTLVKRLDISLIHAHSPLPAALARIGLLGGEIPQVYTEHLPWDRYHPATFWVNALTYFQNDHVFAVSDAVLRSISYPLALRFLPMPPKEILYHGLDSRRISDWQEKPLSRGELGIPKDVPVLGMIGHFRQQKAHAVLLRAVAIVRRELPEIKTVLIGHGPLEQKIRSLATELGLEDSVLFIGSRPDAARALACFDVFVLPSLYEGLPISLLEAMAAGKAIVASSVSGTAELIDHGVHGLLVPPRDVESLSIALTALLTDPVSRHRYGEAAKKRASQFNIDSAVKTWESVYQDLTEDQSGRL